MSLKTILFEANERPGAARRAAFAASFAARLEAHLTGVFLTSNFLNLFMAGQSLEALPPADLEKFLAEQAAKVGRAAEEAREIFEQSARDAGAPSDWLTIGGDTDDDLIAAARRSDLTIVSRIARSSAAEHKISASRLALAAGGPLLVVPEETQPQTAGDRVLVAWNGSRESARALRDAWPLLQRAQEIHVLVVSPRGEGGPDGLLQRQFERHRCKVNLVVDRSRDESAAELIRNHIERFDVDLLVMGLYGRPRFQELLLGGVSDDVLADPPVPVFVSH